jgi:hypothetical protein
MEEYAFILLKVGVELVLYSLELELNQWSYVF